MLPVHRTLPLRLGIAAAAVLAALGAVGCGTGPGFEGKWDTDRTTLIGSPSGENHLAELLAPVPKFSVKFTRDGRCISSWKENGKDGSKTGTWKMVEDQGLKWRIMLKMPSDDEEWEVKVGSPENDKLSLEATDPFKNKGGAIYFTRG